MVLVEFGREGKEIGTFCRRLVAVAEWDPTDQQRGEDTYNIHGMIVDDKWHIGARDSACVLVKPTPKD
jgi:hypothetical protein